MKNIFEKVLSFIVYISLPVGISDEKHTIWDSTYDIIISVTVILGIGAFLVSCGQEDNKDILKDYVSEIWVLNYIDGTTDTITCNKVNQATNYIYTTIKDDSFKTKIPYESLKNFKQIK